MHDNDTNLPDPNPFEGNIDQPEAASVEGETSSGDIVPPEDTVDGASKQASALVEQNQLSATADLDPLLQLALSDLQRRRDLLNQEIDELAKRKKQLEDDLRSSFAGQSDAMARRVKGFQEYLAVALQDLSNSVEQLDLVVQPMVVQPSPLDQASPEPALSESSQPATAVADTFKPDAELIRSALNRFKGQPDVYADPWTLRRSLDQQDIALLEDWFLGQGGRGAQPSRGSRTRNILVSAGLISILGELYGDRFQTLVLADQPERLGEWRRGLQDALGLGREDFGPQSGIVLFERANAVIERADRLEERGDLPMILIDAAEPAVAIPVLQFPLWLAFSAGPDERFDNEDLY